MLFRGEKKGQVTLFIVAAIIIVSLALLFYFFFPGIRTDTFDENNPNQFLASCINQELKDNLDVMLKQGGKLNPDFYYLYNDDRISYLCYNEEYYLLCVVQEPALVENAQLEISNAIKSQADSCFDQLNSRYISKGYETSPRKGEIRVEFLPKRVVVKFEGYSLSISKGSSSTFNNLEAVYNNNVYEMMAIAESIVNTEATYGDSETTIYMDYYRDLKVEKIKRSDGTTVYILTDRNNGQKFQFASRSIAWPPGFG